MNVERLCGSILSVVRGWNRLIPSWLRNGLTHATYLE